MKSKLINRILLVLDCLAVLFLAIVYGPNDTFRTWYVTTSMSTNSHKYLAHIFYTEEQIEEIMSSNTLTIISEFSDDSLITVGVNNDDNLTDLEQQILNNPNNEDYQIIKISGSGYIGWLTVIYDPTRLDLAVTENGQGNTVSELAEQCGAIIAVNGGGFTTGRKSKQASGGLICNGEIWENSEETEEIIAMTTDGKLLLKYSTMQEVYQQYDVSWAVHFIPFLIVNGTSATVTGNAGGQQPRTAIGQRADGIIILMTVDGRGSNGSIGINYADMISIFEQCGCINAANLDGGGSTTLYENGRIINDPATRNSDGERTVYDAIVFK